MNKRYSPTRHPSQRATGKASASDHEIGLGPGPEAGQESTEVAGHMGQQRNVGAGAEQHDGMSGPEGQVEQGEAPSFESSVEYKRHRYERTASDVPCQY